MSVLPIDLQVNLTKASELSDNLARTVNAAQSGKIMENEKIHRESNETNAKVKNLDEYSEEFNKINPESKESNEQGFSGKKGAKKNTNQEPAVYKPAPKEEGTGTIIDIID